MTEIKDKLSETTKISTPGAHMRQFTYRKGCEACTHGICICNTTECHSMGGKNFLCLQSAGLKRRGSLGSVSETVIKLWGGTSSFSE